MFAQLWVNYFLKFNICGKNNSSFMDESMSQSLVSET